MVCGPKNIMSMTIVNSHLFSIGGNKYLKGLFMNYSSIKVAILDIYEEETLFV